MRRSTCERLTCCFFFNDTATTEIYTLSLHDALPISQFRTTRSAVLATLATSLSRCLRSGIARGPIHLRGPSPVVRARSEEHTSELQSRQYLVCRLLLEKKKFKHLHSLFS